jgi:hypothetical protein
MAATAVETQIIEGQRTLVVANQASLPKGLAGLLGEMAPFGFSFRDDFTLAGARPACEVLRSHRWRLFREGRWSNRTAFEVLIGRHVDEGGHETLQTQTVPTGIRRLKLEMCADCGAVAVHDIALQGQVRPLRLLNTETGAVRTAPAVGRRDLVIGWYSGKRRAGREYR